MKYLGIDPGVKGGIALISATGRPITAVNMPDTEQGIVDTIRRIVKKEGKLHVWAGVEFIIDCIPPGRSTPKKAAVLADNWGFCKGVLRALDVATEQITPRDWQTEFDLYGQKFATQTDKKNAHKEVATALFPTVKMTHFISDALLIAEYTRRVYA